MTSRIRDYWNTEPVTLTLNCVLAFFFIAYGLSLSFVNPDQYVKQQEVIAISLWVKLFAAGGLIMLLRVFLQKYGLLSAILHGVALSTLIAWTSVWIIRSIESASSLPATLAYSFVILCCILLPYITPLINRYHRKRR